MPISDFSVSNYGPWTYFFLTLTFCAGIHEPSGPGTDRTDLVRDFLNFIGPGPVQFEIFQIVLVLSWVGPKFPNFFW